MNENDLALWWLDVLEIDGGACLGVGGVGGIIVIEGGDEYESDKWLVEDWCNGDGEMFKGCLAMNVVVGNAYVAEDERSFNVAYDGATIFCFDGSMDWAVGITDGVRDEIDDGSIAGVGDTIWQMEVVAVDGGDIVDGGNVVEGGACESEVEKEAGVDLAISLL